MAQLEPKPSLFGTDGIRGVSGEYPLDHATVWRLGSALGVVLRERAQVSGGGPLRVVIGRDTRESGDWLARLVAGGLASAGIEVSYVGVITTPGVAFLARHHGFAAGIVISASHNLYPDNGIKFLSTAGVKLAKGVEIEIERALQSVLMPSPAVVSIVGRQPELQQDYLGFLEGMAGDCDRFRGRRVAMDCAQGAASKLGPALTKRLGIETQVLNASPDGQNINRDCGSLYPEVVAAATRRTAADLGVAFDGDADRAVFATSTGRVVDGDHVLYAAALFLQDRKELKGAGVVGTLMTNFALERALARRGLSLKRAPVGDRYVLEEMVRSGMNLGGEPSGHIIFGDLSLAGDGLITLLEVLRIMAETGRTLDDLLTGFKPLPQMIVNVRVQTKPELESLPQVAKAVEKCRGDINEEGRVVVRYSGTEAVARVMVEAENAATVASHAEAIAGAIRSAIGVDAVQPYQDREIQDRVRAAE